jgi:hypothetical protein
MIKHLVTSGCSFSDNAGQRWPHYLAKMLHADLYNRGHGSSGNHWISKSAIYQTQQLLDNGISPKEILVVVAWSGIDRKDCFVDSETTNYTALINKLSDHPNPVNFLDNDCNVMNKHSLPTSDGYLSGSAGCNFANKNINNFKQSLILRFFSPQSLAIESYENFLRLQWYCESKGILLLNQTYMDIMHYPHYDWKRTDETFLMTKDWFRNITTLYNMIDFKKWIFWKNFGGIYEYTRDNNLDFYNDKVHPSEDSHKYYVTNFLYPRIVEYEKTKQ